MRLDCTCRHVTKTAYNHLVHVPLPPLSFLSRVWVTMETFALPECRLPSCTSPTVHYTLRHLSHVSTCIQLLQKHCVTDRYYVLQFRSTIHIKKAVKVNIISFTTNDTGVNYLSKYKLEDLPFWSLKTRDAITCTSRVEVEHWRK